MDEEIYDLKMKETKTCLCFPEFVLNFSIGNSAKILTPLWKRHQDIAIPIVLKASPLSTSFEWDEGLTCETNKTEFEKDMKKESLTI